MQRASSAVWDVVVASTPVGLTWLWPEAFSGWVGLVGLPLLACRYHLEQVEQRLSPP